MKTKKKMNFSTNTSKRQDSETDFDKVTRVNDPETEHSVDDL